MSLHTCLSLISSSQSSLLRMASISIRFWRRSSSIRSGLLMLLDGGGLRGNSGRGLNIHFHTSLLFITTHSGYSSAAARTPQFRRLLPYHVGDPAVGERNIPGPTPWLHLSIYYSEWGRFSPLSACSGVELRSPGAAGDAWTR